MKFLPAGFNVKDLEKFCKNKWRWEWLSETDESGDNWSVWLRKPDIAGVAFCECCRKTIKYGSSGKKGLKNHANDANHMKNKNTVKTNQVLPGSSKAKEGIESMQDRVAKNRAIIATFLSEHCLPFKIAPDLLKFAQRLSEDKVALDKTTISKTSATYINTHGVAKYFKTELKDRVKGQFVSLNLDEATNNNNDKIVNVLIQYFDEEESMIVLRHLGSRLQNRSTASDILESIDSILMEYSIDWAQVLSMLMDNCSTMRGIRGGVETLARKKNPNLLDVSGDTVHMINNVAKTLLNSLNENLQSICLDIFYDIEESPKVKDIFQEVQSLINITPKHLIRPISSRFLQMKDVCSRVLELLDPLTIYYESFLTKEEKGRFSEIVKFVLQEHDVREEARAAVSLLQMSQESQQKSATSTDRKRRIITSIFWKRRETVIMLNIFKGLLHTFQDFVKTFQSEKPLVHTLHSRMVDVVKDFLGMFIKPEHIPDSVSQLKKLDVSDEKLQKADKDLGVGKYAFHEMKKARIDKSCSTWMLPLYKNLRSGYIKASKKILNMPIDNKTLRLMTVLDPHFYGHSQVKESLKTLAKNMPQVLPGDELGQLAVDAARYNTDRDVKEFTIQYKEDERIDVGYWVKVFSLKSFNQCRYPALKKLVCAILSIFTGPLIESTFNIMDDIIEKDRTKLTVVNYEAIAVVKTVLRKKNTKSTDIKVPSKMKTSCTNAYATYQRYLKDVKEEKLKRREEKFQTSVQLLKIERAKRVSKLMCLKKRLLAKKRKLENSSSSSISEKQWKRIKTRK